MPAPKLLLDGRVFVESARWHDGRMWFSDWGTREIVAVDAGGNSEVMARVPASLPFCFDWLPDGRLLVVAGPTATLLRQEPDGSLVTHADLSGAGRVFNEIVVDDRGYAYVNGGDFDPKAGGEGFKPGTVAVVTPGGEVRQVADGIEFGNGMAVTADGSTLIVAESHGLRLTAFDIGAGGDLSNRRVWARVDGPPDGICLDAEGAVWYADVPNMRCVRVREGGEVLDTVQADRGCFSCTLGGPDRTTLYITAAVWLGMADGARDGQILTAPAPAAGAGHP
ncbi:MAG: SMP-30/gluconolactonase/LRE family protein [Mycobacteriales bacterium]